VTLTITNIDYLLFVFSLVLLKMKMSCNIIKYLATAVL